MWSLHWRARAREAGREGATYSWVSSDPSTLSAALAWRPHGRAPMPKDVRSSRTVTLVNPPGRGPGGRGGGERARAEKGNARRELAVRRCSSYDAVCGNRFDHLN